VSYQAEFHNRTIALAIRDVGEALYGLASRPRLAKQRRIKAAGGVIYFGYFLLDKQKKVTRQSGETDK